MKKILGTSVAILALAGCATSGHSKDVAAGAKTFNSRTLASSTTVVVNPNQDQSATYPTLAKLCLATNSHQAILAFATAMLNPAEILQVGLQCNVNHIAQSKNTVTFGLTAVRTVEYGTDEYLVTEKLSDAYITRNQNEITIAVKSAAQSAYVVDYYLNLNSAGQPINVKDNFTGVADADMAKSGFYQYQNQDEALKTCILEQDDVGGCSSNVTSSGSKVALTMGAQLFSSVTTPFGWLMNQEPTNTDLDKQAGRVNFTQSMAELTAFIQANYKTQASDVQSVIADAKKAIGSANQ